MTKLERAVAELRADLERHEGGLVKVFADQLEAVLDALEDKPALVANPIRVNPKELVSVPKDPYELFKNYDGLWLLGLTVKSTKKVSVYPSLEVGTPGMVMGYNENTRFVYRVKFEEYGTVSMAYDEIGLSI